MLASEIRPLISWSILIFQLSSTAVVDFEHKGIQLSTYVRSSEKISVPFFRFDDGREFYLDSRFKSPRVIREKEEAHGFNWYWLFYDDVGREIESLIPLFIFRIGLSGRWFCYGLVKKLKKCSEPESKSSSGFTFILFIRSPRERDENILTYRSSFSRKSNFCWTSILRIPFES